jgi:hypothetical protein
MLDQSVGCGPSQERHLGFFGGLVHAIIRLLRRHFYFVWLFLIGLPTRPCCDIGLQPGFTSGGRWWTASGGRSCSRERALHSACRGGFRRCGCFRLLGVSTGGCCCFPVSFVSFGMPLDIRRGCSGADGLHRVRFRPRHGCWCLAAPRLCASQRCRF